MSQTLNVALIGQKFMGRVHSNAYLNAGRFFNLPIQPVMHTIAGLDLISLAPFADRWGWANYSTNWKEIVKDPALDLIDVSTPNYMHAEQAVAALSAGKHVACEKPLAGTLKDARMMRNAAARAKKCRTFVWFNYRRCPAVALAYKLISGGRLGKLYHVRARYLQDWAGPDHPLTWRFQKKYAGTGAHGDLNSHMIDLARFLTGDEISEVSGALGENFISEREVIEPRPKTGGARRGANRRKKPKQGKSDVDDAMMFLCRFSKGAIGSFEASRLASGHANDNSIEISGEHGAIRFSFEEMNRLFFYDHTESRDTAGWREVMCTSAGNHPYAGAWWPDGHVIGYENTFVNMVADMMAIIAGDDPIVPMPDFADAYETQRVLEAASLAAKSRSAVKLTEVK